MKLSKKYKNNIADYKLKNNAIFKYFGEDIGDAIFATVPDADTLSVKLANGEIECSLTEKEKIFFEKQFIVLDKTSDKVNINRTLSIPEELKERIGKMEDKVLDFIYNGGHRLLLTGKKGWGKTTFMRHISRYIIPKLNDYKDSNGNLHNKLCVPIYISFNDKINNLNIAKEKDYHTLFYKDILLGKIRNCCYDYIESDIRKGFYQFLLDKDIFSDYRSQYDKIIDHHKKAWITSDERDKKLDELKTEISKKEETILYSFAYLNDDSSCPAIPVIILDDLDPLHTKVQTYIFTEIYKLAHPYQIKVIVSMRPRSYKIVSYQVADTIQINNHLIFSDSFEDDYLEGKFRRILKHITDKIPVQEGINIGDNLILKPLNAEMFFKNFSSISLNKDVLSFLKNLSGGNLRKLNEFIKVYLKSGYIDADYTIFKNLMENYIDSNSDNNIPIWIVYSAIFTNNHDTVFGMVANEPDKYVVNILCNGSSSINTYLIRLHLLSFFYRNGDNPLSFSTITDGYKHIIEGYSNEIMNDIARAIKRLNNYNLLGNNEILAIPEANNPDKIYKQFDDNVGFYMEQLGRYYYDTIISIFEYFYFMKDDIFFNKDNTGILSCIETKKQKNSLKFEEVIKYFEFLFNEEKSFYEKLDEDQRKYYKNNFAPYDVNKTPNDKIFYVQVFVEKMLDYAKTRKYDGISIIIDKLKNFKNRINETMLEFDDKND